MKTVSFTGPRPQKLDIEPYSIDVIWKKLYDTIEKMITEKGTERFISGGALGIDQMAFMAVHWLKKKYPHIQNIMAIPFLEQPIRWKDEQIEAYEQMKSIADTLVFVDELPQYQVKKGNIIGKYHGSKMQLRNMYMVDEADLLIGVYRESTSGGTYNCIKYAKQVKKPLLYIDMANNLSYKMEKSSR